MKTPTIQLFLGSEGIKAAYELTLASTSMDIKCLSSRYVDVVDNYFDDDYWPRVLKSSIKTREIILNSETGRTYASKLGGSKGEAKNQVAFVEKSLQSESDFIVLDDAILLISYNTQSPFAVYIHDEETAKSMKVQFDLMWSRADKA